MLFWIGLSASVKQQEPTDVTLSEPEVLRHLGLRWVVELDVPDSLLDELGPTGNGSDDLLPEELNWISSKLISKNFLVKKMIQVRIGSPSSFCFFFSLLTYQLIFFFFFFYLLEFNGAQVEIGGDDSRRPSSVVILQKIEEWRKRSVTGGVMVVGGAIAGCPVGLVPHWDS